uniref:DUF6482 family protein n=1 Tax=Thaumasiovibrio occultus TaxID=1891184 RepID=UPI000B354800|nr:DUF6482 family protein [Thaumasiovibrio occultus]
MRTLRHYNDCLPVLLSQADCHFYLLLLRPQPSPNLSSLHATDADNAASTKHVATHDNRGCDELVFDENGACVRFAGLLEAKEQLSDLGYRHAVLRMETPYDEMGAAQGAGAAEIALHLA